MKIANEVSKTYTSLLLLVDKILFQLFQPTCRENNEFLKNSKEEYQKRQNTSHCKNTAPLLGDLMNVSSPAQILPWLLLVTRQIECNKV